MGVFGLTGAGASLYAPAVTLESLGERSAPHERYRRLLLDAGHEETSVWPYAFARFDDGRRVPDAVRQIYRSPGEDALAFGDPFAVDPPTSFRRWRAAPADEGSPPVANLWLAIRRLRPDVQAAYPDPLGADRAGFLTWTATSGAREHDLPPALVAEGERARTHGLECRHAGADSHRRRGSPDRP